MTQEVIKTENLVKKYKDIFANDRINISIKKGDIYGLVGSNGAGKTTFMKLLLGIINPDEGNISILGKMASDINDARSKCGFIVDTPSFYEKMTAFDNLKISAKLKGLTGDIDGWILDSLKKVKLEEKKDIKVKNFSLGMKQSLGIANAILGNPEILILDEPINGLDPIAIANVRDLLLDINKNGTTILISSHILSELEKLATCYGFIFKGKLVKEVSEKEVKANNLDLEQIFLETAKGE